MAYLVNNFFKCVKSPLPQSVAPSYAWNSISVKVKNSQTLQLKAQKVDNSLAKYKQLAALSDQFS